MTNPSGVGSLLPGGVAPLELTFVDFENSFADATLYNMVVDIGALAPAGFSRYTIVTVSGIDGSNRTVASMTIAGVAGTEVAEVPAAQLPTAVYIAETPTGTTGVTVSTTFSASVLGAEIGVYRLIGPPGLTLAGFATQILTTHVSGVMSGSITIPAGGAAVAVAASLNAGNWTWTGFVEQFEQDVDSAGDDSCSGAMSSVDGVLAFTATNSDSTPSALRLVAVSWSPSP